MTPTRSLSLLAVAAAGLVSAGTANAATLALDHACYLDTGSSQQPIVASATGLTPGADYNIGFTAKGASGETGYAYGPADGSGNGAFSINSWFGGSTYKVKTYDGTVVLRDSATNTVLAQQDVKTSPITFEVTGSGKNRSWKVTGLAAFTGGTTYYAHYFNNNKYKGRLKIGKPSGPCGYYSGKRPLTPFAKLGRYDVKITTTKKWAKGDAFIGGRVVVTTRYR